MSSPSETDLQRVARQAAIEVEEEFENISSLRNDSVAAMVAAFDPEEIMIETTLKSGKCFTISELRGISLRYGRDPPFDEAMEEIRDRFAERSCEGNFAVKCVNRGAIEKDKETAASTAAALIVETKILMNLEKHPHICQLYGMNANGTDAMFGSKIMEEDFFLIIDAISETLPERMQAWREKKCYEGERFDDLAQRQSQLTQRLEVALDICSAMTFLSNRNIVYFLHPEKVGFDSRYKRIKLFQFGYARESGKETFFPYEEADMLKRVYLAPEVLVRKDVTVSADVYAFGMLLWETLTLRHPFEGMSKEAHLTQVVNGRTRPHLNKTWPSNLRHLIEDCWDSRPTMKEVYDQLENCLLFQDFGGIDRTEDHERTKSKNRKIRYQRNAEEPITEEERDRDSKSTRSRDSLRSRESLRSKESLRSRESLRSKESTSRRSERSSRSNDSGENGLKSSRSNSRRSSHHKSSSDDRSSRPSLHKTRGEDESLEVVPLNDLDDCDPPSTRRQTSVKEKDGKIHRRTSEGGSSRHQYPHDDGDDRTASSEKRSVKGKDGKIRRTAESGSHDDRDDRTASSEKRSVKGKDGKIRRGTTEGGSHDDGDDRTASSEKRSVKGKDGKIRRRATEGGSHDDGDDRTESSEKRSVKGNDGRIRRTRPTHRPSGDGPLPRLRGSQSEEGSLQDAVDTLGETYDNTADSATADADDPGARGGNRSKPGSSDGRAGRLNRSKSSSESFGDETDERTATGNRRRSPTRGANKARSSSVLSQRRDDGLVRQSSFKRQSSSKRINWRSSNSDDNVLNSSTQNPSSRRPTRGTLEPSTRRLGRNKSAGLENLASSVASSKAAPASRLVGRSKSSDDFFGDKSEEMNGSSDSSRCLGFVEEDRKSEEKTERSSNDISERSKWTAFEAEKVEEEPNCRGNLTPSRSGLLKPAMKDTTRSNRARVLKEKSSIITDKDTGSSAHTKQRSAHMQQRRSSTGHNRPVLIAAKEKSFAKRKPKSRRSLAHDTTLLKGVFVDK